MKKGLYILVLLPIFFGCTRNHPPEIPCLIYPANGSENVEVPLLFRWRCNDPDGDSLKYTLQVNDNGNIQNHITHTDSIEFDNLDPETSYTWKIIASDDEYSVESATHSFATKSHVAPRVSTDSVKVYLDGGVRIWGHVIDSISNPEAIFGFNLIYERHGSPYSKYHIIEPNEEFELYIIDLPKNSLFKVRAFSKLPTEEYSFGRLIERWTTPIFGTISVFEERGGLRLSVPIQSHYELHAGGFCFSTQDDPTYPDDQYEISSKLDVTTWSIDPDSSYYVRAFIITDIGLQYSQTIKVDCPTCCKVHVETMGVDSVGHYQAIIKGDYQNSCEQFYWERGFLFSNNFDLSDSLEIRRLNNEPFAASINYLKDNTNYFFAAYIKRGRSQKFGKTHTFKTPKDTTSGLVVGIERPEVIVTKYDQPISIQPDFMTNGYIHLDLDSDSITDIKVAAREGSSPGGYRYYYVNVSLNEETSVICEGRYISKFDYGDHLNDSVYWQTDQAEFYQRGTYSSSPWAKKTGYLVFRIHKGDIYRHGWVKIGFSSSVTNVTVYEYALEINPRQVY